MGTPSWSSRCEPCLYKPLNAVAKATKCRAFAQSQTPALQLVQRGANVHHMGQAKTGTGTTMALHECAAMMGDGRQEPDAYFETAWLLMGAGASPFMERSDGMYHLANHQLRVV